jgi:hypothetical protein
MLGIAPHSILSSETSEHHRLNIVGGPMLARRPFGAVFCPAVDRFFYRDRSFDLCPQSAAKRL